MDPAAYEIRREKWHHVIDFMIRRAPRNVRREREYFFEEICSPATYVRRIEKIRMEIANELGRRESKRHAIQRCKAIKEELMAVCWHPDRVEKLLELGILEQVW